MAKQVLGTPQHCVLPSCGTWHMPGAHGTHHTPILVSKHTELCQSKHTGVGVRERELTLPVTEAVGHLSHLGNVLPPYGVCVNMKGNSG